MGHVYKHIMSSSFWEGMVGIFARASHGYETMSLITHWYFQCKTYFLWKHHEAWAMCSPHISSASYFGRYGTKGAISDLLGNDGKVEGGRWSHQTLRKGQCSFSLTVRLHEPWEEPGGSAGKDAAVHCKVFGHWLQLHMPLASISFLEETAPGNMGSFCMEFIIHDMAHQNNST